MDLFYKTISDSRFTEAIKFHFFSIFDTVDAESMILPSFNFHRSYRRETRRLSFGISILKKALRQTEKWIVSALTRVQLLVNQYEEKSVLQNRKLSARGLPYGEKHVINHFTGTVPVKILLNNSKRRNVTSECECLKRVADNKINNL